MEIVNSFITSVSCTGKEALYDHPKIYLEIPPENGEIFCPYCNRKFKLIEKT